MQERKITIDGKEYKASPGETILQVARREGFGERIPTLCYEPALPPYTSCFVCIVEVEGMNKLVPACSTEAGNGMVVHTQSPRVEKARKTSLELLMSNHPADCMAPCSRGCPAGIDIQQYLALAKEGKYIEAIQTIRERNPLPVLCGRVCVRRCEEVCRRDILDEPVGINMVKRTASDYWIEHPYEEVPGDATGKHVAIIGGGPAGLTAAYFLRLKGHRVTIFEMHDKLGGMVRWGIPDYRLPQKLLDWEIQQILDLGVEARLNTRIGRDVTMDELHNDFDAIFVSVGAQLGTGARIKGEDHPAVFTGVQYLDDVKNDCAVNVEGKKVVIVGGGNTAIDASRTALRAKSEHVTILYRRTRNEMPANDEEIVAADEEGVRMEFLITPTQVVADEDGTFKGLTCIKMQLGEPDSSGRRRPVPVPDSDHFVACDVVIEAIGQKVDLDGLTQVGDKELDLSRWGTVEADEYSCSTNVEGIFAGGDCVTGPAVVIDAIGWGRKAALSIEQYLTVGAASRILDKYSSRKENYGELRKSDLPPSSNAKRAHLGEADPAERITHFNEGEFSIPDHEVEEEAGRCLSCGCAASKDCELRDLAERYSVDETAKHQAVMHRIDRSNPYIIMDPNKCILCTRCIRTCSDILGIAALGLIDRGFETIVRPTLGRPLTETECISCGNCVDACPTGALNFKGLHRTDPVIEKAPSVCTLCEELCDIEVGDNLFGHSVRVTEDEDGIRQMICKLGRFGNEEFLAGDRVTQPWVRKQGVLEPATWDEAVDAAIAGLKKVADTHGTDAVLVSGSGELSCEEAALLAAVGNEGFGARTVSLSSLASNADGYSLNGFQGSTASTASFADLENASVVVVVGEDPTVKNPVAAARIRRAHRNGATIISITDSHSGLMRLSSAWLEARKGTHSLVMGWLLSKVIRSAQSVPEEVTAVAHALAAVNPKRVARDTGVNLDQLDAAGAILAQADGPVVGLYNVEGENRSPDDLLMLAEMVELAGAGSKSGVVLTANSANLAGIKRAGLLPESEGQQEEIVTALHGGEILGAWLLREDPLSDPESRDIFENVEFLVVQDVFDSLTAGRADVVLPASTHFETGGTFVRSDGTLRNAAPVIDAVVERSVQDVLNAVLKATKVASPEVDLSKCDESPAIAGWPVPKPGVDTSHRHDAQIRTSLTSIPAKLLI